MFFYAVYVAGSDIAYKICGVPSDIRYRLYAAIKFVANVTDKIRYRLYAALKRLTDRLYRLVNYFYAHLEPP